MKRKQLLIFVIWLGFVFVGCGRIAENTVTTQESNAQNQYMMASSVSFQETDDCFYGNSLFGRFLQYYDKNSGVAGILCANPACMHDSSDCGAYMQAGATLSVCDGKLYWVAQDQQNGRDYALWRSDLAGMNREKVKPISFEDVVLTYQPQRYAVHRGKLFILGQFSSVTGTQVGYQVSVLSAPLDGSEDMTVLYEEQIDRGVQSTVRFVGDAVYLSLVTFPEGGPFDVTVMKFDIQDGKQSILYHESGMTVIPGDFWITEQEELYLPGADTDHAYVWKIENGIRKEMISWDGSDPSVPKILDGIAIYFSMDGRDRHIGIADLNGEVVYDGVLFPEGILGANGDPNEYGFTVVGGDAEKIILNLQDFSSSQFANYTVMLDLKNHLKPTVLWSSQ